MPTTPNPPARPSDPVSLTLLFDASPTRDAAALQQTLAAIGARLEGMVPGLPERLEGGIVGYICLDGQRIRCFEMDAPAPGLEEVIATTPLAREKLPPLLTHRAHLMLWHEEDGIAARERLITLLRLAAAFIPLGLMGVIHGDAGLCYPTSSVAAMTDAEGLVQLRGEAGLIALCNLIPMQAKDGLWWMSRGHHILGMPDLAILDDGSLGPAQARELVCSFISYLQGGAQVAPGHTVHLGARLFQIGQLGAQQPTGGPGTMLTFRPVDHQPMANAVGPHSPPSGCIVVAVGLGLLLLGLILAVPRHPFESYTGTKVVLGISGGLCLATALLLFLRSRRGS